jgi:hypothetical protein
MDIRAKSRVLLHQPFLAGYRRPIRKEIDMKQLFVVMMTALFLSGCGAVARESGYYEHKTLYKNWDHMKFSVCGYNSVDQKEVQMSKEQDWWGLTVERSDK